MAKYKRTETDPPELEPVDLPIPKPLGRPPRMSHLTILVDEIFMMAPPTEKVEFKNADARIAEIRSNGIAKKGSGTLTNYVFPSAIRGIRRKDL